MLIVYRTPSCTAAKTDQLFKVMSDLSANEKHVIIVGDFNIPECYPTNNSKSAGASALHELMYHHDLTQHVTQPTRGCNILDFVFSSSKTIIENLSVCSPMGASDHNSITFDIRCDAMESTPVYRRLYSQCNYEVVCSTLAQIRWRELFETRNSVNEKYELFLFVLRASIEFYVPFKLVSSLKTTALPKHLQNMVSHRECLFLEARRTGNWDSFNMFNKKFITHLKKYNNFLEKKAIESGNIRNFYAFVNGKIRENKSVSFLTTGGVVANSAAGKANMLADQFEKIFQRDDSAIPVFSGRTPAQNMKDFPWFAADHLYALINKWPSSFSVTPDLIPLHFVKKISSVICGPLAYLFNQSLMHGEVPQRWKHCFITPILKKEPAVNPENYRPVSITSVFCRVFEKVLKDHMMSHI